MHLVHFLKPFWGGAVQKYDVAVIGAGLGGLAAAAQLSAQKKKTVVIERGASLNDALGVVEKSGFGFYAGPSLSYGFETHGALQVFSTQLGIVQHTSVPTPCYQVALPDRRITVFAEREATLEELRREFPAEISMLSQLYRDLDKVRVKTTKNRISAYFAAHRAASRFLSKYGLSRELMAFFDVQSYSFFQQAAGKLSLATFMMLCDTPPRRVQGGFRKFGDQLYGVLLRHGGEVRYNESLPELVIKDNRVIGIQTAQGVVEANTYILNSLPQQRKALLFVGLREDVIPVGMSYDVLLLTDYSRPQEIIALSLNGNKEDAVAPKGMRSLTALFQSPQNTAVDKCALVDKLGRLIPFLDDYIVFAEEFRPEAGFTALTVGIKIKPLGMSGEASVINRTSYNNVFVLHDRPEAPLQVITAVRRFAEKSG
jgi:glycine/D-amino acid oxidase-like deaminating enzyme